MIFSTKLRKMYLDIQLPAYSVHIKLDTPPYSRALLESFSYVRRLFHDILVRKPLMGDAGVRKDSCASVVLPGATTILDLHLYSDSGVEADTHVDVLHNIDFELGLHTKTTSDILYSNRKFDLCHPIASTSTCLRSLRSTRSTSSFPLEMRVFSRQRSWTPLFSPILGTQRSVSYSHSQWVQLVRSDVHLLGEETTADAIISTR